MINNFYSSISNGNLVDKSSHVGHYVPELAYLLKSNFLGEFRTALEKAKVRATLGIADSETLYWGNILGDIAEQQDISAYINSLLSFDYSIQNNFEAGDNFENIKNVRDAAITCLDYLSKFKGEGEEIQELDNKIKEILNNLYNVDSLENIEDSEGGVITRLISEVTTLKELLGDPETTVEEIETKLNEVEDAVSDLNDILSNINSLLVKYIPKDGSKNALEIIDDKEVKKTQQKIDSEGLPVTDGLGFPVYEEVTVIEKGGLYVKDLQPQIDELNEAMNGETGKISELSGKIDENSENISKNSEKIEEIQTETIPRINQEIKNIKKDYISKESLGSSSTIITEDKLTDKLKGYIKTNSKASLSGITSEGDSIEVNKPFKFNTNDPGDSRRYVLTREDLLKIENYWPGMEVIVIEDALMYILKKNGNPADPTYDGWKIADSLKLEVLTREEFELRLKIGDLDPLVYYYIHSEPVTFREYPSRSDYDSDTEFNYAVDLWKQDAYILQGLYMSAAWGQDIDNRLKYKVDKANFEVITNKVNTIETFFNSTDGDTLSSLKASIQYIYKPAYVETDSLGKPVNKPESGILVTLSDKVNAIDKRVEVLEGAGFVKWSEVGEENSIVTNNQLTETLENYVEKNSTAPLKGITSENDTITIDKPFAAQSGFPLDERRYVENYQDLYSVNPATAFEGMEVIVKQDGFIMMLQDLTNISNDKGWKNVGLASIAEITLEEYQLRANNTNEDGSSKGHCYEGTTTEIPTLVGNVYYFIKETPITFTKLPERNGRTDEEWIADLEAWKKDTYKLWGMFLTASWGEDMNSKVNNKADLASFIASKRITDENREYILDILSLLEILNGYFEEATDSKIKDIIAAATKLQTDLIALSTDYAGVKLDLYGKEAVKPKFVTWAALGGEEGDALDSGQTLFVKTTIYEADKLSNSKETITEKLTLPGTKIIHHDAVEEVSHNDASTGEKVIDVEGKEAYDETVSDPLSIVREDKRIKVGEEEVAFRNDLLKSVEFDSYPIYFNWINGSGTIDGQEGSPTYSEWSSDKNLEEWYFLIKYDGTVLPSKNSGETLEQYEARIEPFKKGMLLTVYDAETIYATANALLATSDSLNTKVNYLAMRIDRINLEVNNALDNQNKNIENFEKTLTESFTELSESTDAKNTETRNLFYTSWGRFYDPVENACIDLGTIIDDSETKIRKSLAAFLKKYTTQECERIAASKLAESKFLEIWDTYYIANDTVTYTPLKDILAEIIGNPEDGESLSLTSLKAQIDLREIITDHAADITSVRLELLDAIDETRAYANLLSGEALRIATDACLNAIPITYSELKYLRDSGGLIPGRRYRLIDYKTTSKESNTKVIWHQFDLILTADSNYELSEIAYAVIPDSSMSSMLPHNEEDTFVGLLEEEENNTVTLDDYYKNCNLTAWEIKYTIDNDTSRYSWVDDRYIALEAFNTFEEGDIVLLDLYNQLDDTNKAKCQQIGKGVIYYLKDEFGNECSYDFKSILFERFYIEALTSQKNMSDWIVNKYYSALSTTLENLDTIIPHYKSLNGVGAETRFYYTFDTGLTMQFLNGQTGEIEERPVELTWYNANQNKNTCRDNHFAYPCNLYNVVQNGTGTTVLIDKNRIVLNNNVFIGNNFVSNTCNDQGFAYNTVLDGMSFNTIGGNFAFNIIASNFTNNKLGYDCKLNIINSGFNYNVAGNKFLKNCISTNCENNTFRELIVNNAFSHHNTENIFGNNIHDCEFPDYFKNNELGGDIVELKIADTAHYMQFCEFNKGIHLITILDSLKRSSSSKWYQYIHFNWSYFSTLTNIDLSGGDFQGTGNNFSIAPGNNYIIEILDSSTAHLGYVWCPADLITVIRNLSTRVTNAETKISTIEKSITDLQKDLATVTSSVASEAAYANKIANVVKQLATLLGVTVDLDRT